MSELQGTFSYDNWKAQIANEPILARYEFELYSDAWFVGEITSELGPYQFFNLVSPMHTGYVRRSAVLRYSQYIRIETKIDKTDPSRYHGGQASDEIAALASLLMGSRIYAGGASRSFRPGGEPEGRPERLEFKAAPTLLVGPRGSILPNALGQHSLMNLEKMVLYPKLTSSDAILLTRAARLYQEALWLIESEPHLSWLMIVSAVETIADRYAQQNTPLERLKECLSLHFFHY